MLVLFVLVIRGTMDSQSFQVEGFDTTFENVYDVCMYIWQRIVTMYKGIVKEYGTLFG